MVVTSKNIKEVVEILSQPGEYGLDTETTGLLEKHRLFSIIIASEEDVYYFNFKDYGIKSIPFLGREHFELFQKILDQSDSTFFISNAKFDMRMFLNEGLQIRGTAWCTAAQARVLENNLGPKEYSLNALAKRYLGLEKDDAVKTYVEQNQLWDIETWFGETIYHHRYQDVPYDIMHKYACMDAQLHLKLGKFQKTRFREIESNKNEPSIAPLVLNELNLTKTLFKCERIGIKVDRQKIKDAMREDQLLITGLRHQFYRESGSEFYDGPNLLAAVFKKLGIPVALTEKGNPSFAEKELSKLDHPVVSIVQDIRWYTKRMQTYYPNLLRYSDMSGIIHPDIRQGGTETGRMSCVNPNLTNVPSEEGSDVKYPMRGHFIPRYPSSCLVTIDYKQQELRMFLDLAGEKSVIKAINEGLDPHQATADEVGITRQEAKTVNFALIYGQGIEALAQGLKVDTKTAKDIRDKYFAKLPKVKKLIETISKKGKATLYVTNWFGRRCRISDKDYAYILPNHTVQGGCADVVKIAMNETFKLERSERIKSPGLLFSVHDELVLELFPEDFKIIKPIKNIMENVYKPKNGMKLLVDISHSFKSWAERDMIEGEPTCEPINQSSQSSHQMHTGSTLQL